MSYKLWNKEDDEIIRKFYPSFDYKNILESLSHKRTISSIRARAIRLGIKGDKYWTEQELSEFKERYPSEGASNEMCMKFNRSKGNLWAVAGQLGIKSEKEFKGKNHPIYTGFEDVSGSYVLNLKKAAIRRGIEFSISAKDIYNQLAKQDKKCFYSGREISFLDKTASVDRIDSSIGYIISNIQIVHKFTNSSKNKKTNEEFLDWVKIIYNFNFA